MVIKIAATIYETPLAQPLRGWTLSLDYILIEQIRKQRS